MKLQAQLSGMTREFRINEPLDTGDLQDGWLTDEHARSSYGQPVLVIEGTAYGPADLNQRYPHGWTINMEPDATEPVPYLPGQTAGLLSPAGHNFLDAARGLYGESSVFCFGDGLA